MYFEVDDVLYLKKLHEFHNHLPFLQEIMKIEKVENLVANFDDKTKYLIHIKKFKTSIKSWINFKKRS